MWHSLEVIAESNFFEPKKFLRFASTAENIQKHGLVEEDGRLIAGTYYINDLVRDYRSSMTPEEAAQERAAEVQKQKEKWNARTQASKNTG